MSIKWIDTKTVLLVDKKHYHAGDIVPDGSLSDERIELFEKLKQIEIVDEKPEKKPRKTSAKKPEQFEEVENAGPEK